jgi:hypothetical protein
MGSLQKFAVLDPRIEVSEQFKKWFVMLGGSDVNTFVYQTSQFSQSNMTFNINIANNQNALIDRHSAIVAVPITVAMAGDGLGTGNIYQPDKEGLRCRPLDKITQMATFSLNGSAISYQVNELTSIQEKFEDNVNNAQMTPTMVDRTQSYSGTYGTNRSPFALWADNNNEVTRRAYPITVVSNTTTSAVLQTTLYQNLFDWGVFSKDFDVVGINIYPFTIGYTFLAGAGLSRLWSRDIVNHTQHLTSLTVTFQQPQITMSVISLPIGQKLPDVMTYPYHKVDYYPTTTPSYAQSLTTVRQITSQLIELQSPPEKIYIGLKPSTNSVLSSVSNAVSFTDTFAEIVGNSYIYGNKTNLLASQTQVDIFQMTKRNGLPDKFGFVDWTGEQGVLGTDPLLMGSIVAIDPVRDFAGEHVTGMAEKLQFQATISFKTINPATTTYDMFIIVVYDGILVQAQGNSTLSTLVISSPNELQLSPISYNQMKSLVGGSKIGDFFKSSWSKIKTVAGPIIKFLRDNKVISSVASMIPASTPYIGPVAQTVGTVARSLGFGDGVGDGGNFYNNFDGGDGGDDGGWIAGDDGGVLAGGKRLRKSSLRKKLGNYRR